MPKRSTPADALRSAVDQTFHAAAGQAQTTRGRAQELVDELSHTAGRLRGALDELRLPTGEDLRNLRSVLGDLERRVSALERSLVSTAQPRSRAASAKRGGSATRPKRAARTPAKAKRSSKSPAKAQRSSRAKTKTATGSRAKSATKSTAKRASTGTSGARRAGTGRRPSR